VFSEVNSKEAEDGRQKNQAMFESSSNAKRAISF
jgi:hypothetical protein